MKKIASLFILCLLIGTVHAEVAKTEEKQTADDNRVIATVLDRKITAKEITDKDRLTGIIFGTLLEKFAKDNKIEPTEKELDDFRKAMVLAEREWEKEFDKKFSDGTAELRQELKKLTAELKDTGLGKEEQDKKAKRVEEIKKTLKEHDESMRGIAAMFVGSWKVNKALYDKYGGRVIFQQAGVEPLDAYRQFLKEHQKKGSFKILDKKYEADFWNYFVNDRMHTFLNKNPKKTMATPWWYEILEKERQKQKKAAEPE